MKIIFVGGGTAGHINPALALADYVKTHDTSAKILYVGALGSMEEKLVTKAGYDFQGITVSGFSRGLNFNSIKKNLKTIKNIFISSIQSKKILKKFAPDICVGTGGYVCGTFLRESGKLGIPFLIHDSNSFPGLTTKLLAKRASKVLIVSEEAKKYLPKNIKTEITGTPVRNSIASMSKEKAKKILNLDDNPTILSFGGSLGAKAINNVMSEVIPQALKNTNYNFIHGFGKNGHYFEKILKEKGINITNNSKLIIKEYIDNMDQCMAAADLVICRAGATTLSEIQISSKPAILIPSPNVAENHQFHNAMSLVNKNAADIIEEKKLSKDLLLSEIIKILGNNKQVATIYSKNLKKIAITNASEKIYKIIKETICK